MHASRHSAAVGQRGSAYSRAILPGLATLLAVWLGLTAPAVSPVAPVPTLSQLAAGSTAAQGMMQPAQPLDKQPGPGGL